MSSSLALRKSKAIQISVLDAEVLDADQVEPVRYQTWRKTQLILRIITLITSTLSMTIITTNVDSIDDFGFPHYINYSDDPNIKFFAFANFVVAVSSVLTVILCGPSSKSIKPTVIYLLFLHDLITLILMTAACAVVTSVAYGFVGGKHVNTMAAICHSVYCIKGTVAGALSYVCFVSIFLLSVHSAKKI